MVSAKQQLLALLLAQMGFWSKYDNYNLHELSQGNEAQ